MQQKEPSKAAKARAFAKQPTERMPLTAPEAAQQSDPMLTWPSRAESIFNTCMAKISDAIRKGQYCCELLLSELNHGVCLSKQEIQQFQSDSPTAMRIVIAELSRLGYGVGVIRSPDDACGISIRWDHAATNSQTEATGLSFNWWVNATRIIAEYQDGLRTLSNPQCSRGVEAVKQPVLATWPQGAAEHPTTGPVAPPSPDSAHCLVRPEDDNPF